MNTGEYLLAEGADDDVALVDGPRSYRYRELRDEVDRLAGRLAAVGLAPGSRVALLAPNSVFWVASYLAVMRLGHVVVPLPDRLRPAELRDALDQGRCAAALASARLAPSLRELSLPVLAEDVPADARRPAAVPDPEDDQVPGGGRTVVDPVNLDADAAVMFTSGTTARPRAVRITHRNIQANTESIVASLGLRRDDRILVVLPFHYCFGASLLHTHLRVGACLVLCPTLTYPEAVVDLLATQGCTEFAGVPSSFQLLLRASSFATRELPALRLLQAAGGKLPESVVEQLRAARPTAALFLMYGQTEATARLSCLPPAALPAKPGSIGRGIPGVDLCVRDEQGRPVPPGQRGEIYARGANISPGYLDDPEATAEKFTEHGLRTGDIAVVDADGDIYVVDRRDDFIKSWGYRISSQHVEACAMRLPEVIQAAAVGIPDPQAGEAITLFLVLRPASALTSGDVLGHCRRLLARHEVPQSVMLVGAMPLNRNGKIEKSRLREMAVRA